MKRCGRFEEAAAARALLMGPENSGKTSMSPLRRGGQEPVSEPVENV